MPSPRLLSAVPLALVPLLSKARPAQIRPLLGTRNCVDPGLNVKSATALGLKDIALNVIESSRVPGPPLVPLSAKKKTDGRALVAVPLKFAILNVKPVTACPAEPAARVRSSAAVRVMKNEPLLAAPPCA